MNSEELAAAKQRETERQRQVLERTLADTRDRIIQWVCGSAVLAMFVGLGFGWLIWG